MSETTPTTDTQGTPTPDPAPIPPPPPVTLPKPAAPKPPAAAPVAKQKYKLNTGLNWLINPDGDRDDPANWTAAEAGEVRDDLLDISIPWLLEGGLITPVEG